MRDANNNIELKTTELLSEIERYKALTVDQISFHKSQIEWAKKDTDVPKRMKHEGFLREFQGLSLFLDHIKPYLTEEYPKINQPIIVDPEAKSNLSLDDLSDLPPEIRDELSIGRTDDLEEKILNLISDNGGTARLDQIIVGLFRKYGIKDKKRIQIASKMNRMEARKHLIQRVPKKKGWYTLLGQNSEK